MLQYQPNQPPASAFLIPLETNPSSLNSPPPIEQLSPIRQIETPISLDLYNQNQNFIIGSLKQISVVQDPLSLNSNVQNDKTLIKQNKIGQQVSFNFTPIKQKQQRSNFLSPGAIIFDTSNISVEKEKEKQKNKEKDSNENQKIIIPYGTKVSNISQIPQIQRKLSEEFDESLLQLTKTLKRKDSSFGERQRDDSLVYSNGSMSHIFITPIKNIKGQVELEHKSEKCSTDQKTAKTSSGEFESPNAENNDESKVEIVQIGDKINNTQQQQQNKESQYNPRINSRKLNSKEQKLLKQQISSKTLSNPSKLNKKRKLYHSSLGRSDNLKLKQAEQKKKQLQRQLQFLNGQINIIKQGSPRPHNNLIQRINISDDINAKMKAIQLVHRLNAEKKQRHKVWQEQVVQGHKNIFQNFDEIRKAKEQREQKEKQKKRIEVIERMKQQEIRKNQIKKLQKANVKFLKNVIWAETVPLKLIEQKSDVFEQDQKVKEDHIEEYESRMMERKEEEKKKMIDEGKTPELDSKKSRLKKIRNFENVQVKSILEEYNALLFRK